MRRNIAANFGGRAVVGATGLIFIPIYIRFLGIESYGLIGFFSLLTSLAAVLDLGLSPTMCRELARLSTQADAAKGSRDLVRTLEVLYAGVGVVIGLTVILLAPVIAHRWINANQLSAQAVQQAVMLMGILLALQWPLSFYEGGLLGLQRMGEYNAMLSVVQLTRSLGAVAVLSFVSPTIMAFFIWQIIISAAGVMVCAFWLWRCLPAGPRAVFSRERLRSVWRFAAGMTGISVAGIALTLSDKLVLSKRMPLADFGYYNLAVVTAASLYYLVYPLSAAVFPRLSQWVAAGDERELSRTYHFSCQLLSLIICPPAIVLAFFSHEMMLAWTGNEVTASHTATITSIAAIATLLSGFVNLPYQLQLAYGRTRLPLLANVILLTVQLPTLFYVIDRYGAVGAACVWLGLQIVYFTLIVNLFYRKSLPQARWRWYGQDVGAPLAASLVVVILARWSMPVLPRVASVAALGLTMGIAFVAAALATPLGRTTLMSGANAVRGRFSRGTVA